METIYQSEILAVHYTEAEKKILITCTGNISGRELKVSYRKALKFATKKQVKRWLFDFSRNYQLSEKNQVWLDTSFFPSLMIALGSDNYIGLVVPKLTYRKMFQEAGPSGMQTYNSFIKLNTFCSNPKAARWLINQTAAEQSYCL
jgi:hypothetical protein